MGIGVLFGKSWLWAKSEKWHVNRLNQLVEFKKHLEAQRDEEYKKFREMAKDKSHWIQREDGTQVQDTALVRQINVWGTPVKCPERSESATRCEAKFLSRPFIKNEVQLSIRRKCKNCFPSDIL